MKGAHDPQLASIMLVEDNPGDVRLIREAFSGCMLCNELMVQPDGQAALDYLRTAPDDGLPDLVLLDLNLPRVTGQDVLRTMRADARLRRICTVILTSSSAERDIVQSYDLGANAYVCKPIRLDEIKDMVARLEGFWIGVVKFAPRGSGR